MKKIGFTLAEVLITVGIIGVVSALTLPTLVKNYRNEVLAKSLTAAISDFEVAMQAYLLKEDTDDLWDTPAWRTPDGQPVYIDENSDSDNSRSERFASEISRVMPLTAEGDCAGFYGGKTIKTLAGASSFSPLYERKVFLSKKNVTYNIQIISDNEDTKSHNLFRLPMASLYREGINLRKIAAEVVIDVNSTDLPNVLGRDIFYYWLGADGKLYPYHSKDYSRFLFLRDGAVTGSTYENPEEKCKEELNGIYCAAYLQENGYKIDY